MPSSKQRYNKFMDTKTKLNEAMKDAMKSGDNLRKQTIRMVLAAVKQVEVDKRVDLDEATITALLQKEVKNRREAIEEAKKANREDLIAGNESEIKSLRNFCPRLCP
jgi:uncharacterized protein YqeY